MVQRSFKNKKKEEDKAKTASEDVKNKESRDNRTLYMAGIGQMTENQIK